jgi:hypothetical protein
MQQFVTVQPSQRHHREIQNYTDLKEELTRIWQLKAVYIILLVLSTTGIFFSWRDNPLVVLGLLIHEVFFFDHTQRHTTLGRTPLDE